MWVEKAMRGDVTVVSLIGNLDNATAAQVRAGLDNVVPRDGRLLLDLSRISYLSSAGVRVLLLLYRQARQNSTRLALASMPADIQATLSATRFIDALLITDTVEAGVRALSR
jgi:anti-sigma B factor antagonist